MKIGVLSSGMESLALFKFLHRYEHEYVIYFDSLYAPYGSKKLETCLQITQNAIARFKKQGVEQVILPPVLELAYLQGENEDKNLILPLFSSYLQEEVFVHSLVGKMGVFGGREEVKVAQDLIAQLATGYSPTSAQLASKKFAFPFHFWGKATDIFVPLLNKLGWKTLLTNTVIKHDLRYFKDAMVDSLIPLSYAYFHAEVTISKFLNFKKIRFHRLGKLENIFKKLTADAETSPYQVQIYATDSLEALREEKRIVWLLQRGKKIKIVIID